MRQAKTGMPVETVAPRVSVICIFLNEQRFLPGALASVWQQDFADWELILVDDGSHDASAEYARRLASERANAVYLEHPGHENRGMSASRNLGLAHARGDLVAFIDADDVWRPEKLGEQVALMDALPTVGMLCGRVNYWRSWDGGVDRLIATGYRLNTIIEPAEALLRLYPLGVAGAPSPSDVMLRRHLIEAVGGFEDRFTGMFEDQVFFAKIFAAARVLFSDRVWLDYRLHPDSCSSVAERAGRYAMHRRQYLEWLRDYIAKIGPPRTAAIGRAVARELWKLEHPNIARRWNKALRAVQRIRDGVRNLAESPPPLLPPPSS